MRGLVVWALVLCVLTSLCSGQSRDSGEAEREDEEAWDSREERREERKEEERREERTEEERKEERREEEQPAVKQAQQQQQRSVLSASLVSAVRVRSTAVTPTTTRVTTLSSSWPAWAVAVAVLGSVSVVCGVALLTAALCLRRTVATDSSHYVSLDTTADKRPTVLLCVALALTVVGAAALATAVTLATSSSSAAPSAAVRAAVVTLDSPVLGVCVRKLNAKGIPYSDHTRFTFVRDNNGRRRARLFAENNNGNGNNNNNGPKRRSTSVSLQNVPLNRKLTGTASIGPDGKLILQDNWAVQPGQRDGAVTTSTRKLIVYRVMLSGVKPCGTDAAPADCVVPCPMTDIESMLITSPKSISNLFKTLSNGQLVLTGSAKEWVDVTIPGDTSLFDMPYAIDAIVGPRNRDHLSFFLPPNFQRGLFGSGAIGLGTLGFKWTWMVQCNAQTFAHEFGHNLNLMHAGAWTPAGDYNEYADVTSAMSYTLSGPSFGPFRGLSAAQIDQMGWLPATARLDITQSGDYSISSLSSMSGQYAARILVPGTAPIWVEWREATAFDLDLPAAQVFVQLIRNGGKIVGGFLVKMLSAEGKSQLFGVADASGQKVEFSNGISIQYLSQGRFRCTLPVSSTTAATTTATATTVAESATGATSLESTTFPNAPGTSFAGTTIESGTNFASTTFSSAPGTSFAGTTIESGTNFASTTFPNAPGTSFAGTTIESGTNFASTTFPNAPGTSFAGTTEVDTGIPTTIPPTFGSTTVNGDNGPTTGATTAPGVQ